MGLVAGVLALNVLIVATGYCLLRPCLRAASLGALVTYAGLALLAGAGVTATIEAALALTGVELGLWSFAVSAGLAACAGLVTGRLLPGRIARAVEHAPPPARPHRALADSVSTVAALAVAAVALANVVGGFRSSPWLDDIWFFFASKAVALHAGGLDPRVFAPNETYVFFYRTDNPLWWPVVIGWDFSFVGALDLRAVNAQLAIFVAAFAAAAARLLWGHVRPAVLWPSLLLVVSAPELLRQAQGGTADLVLALYLGLALVAAVLWLAGGGAFHLVALVLLGTGAIGAKAEGLLQLVLFAAVAAIIAWAVRRRPPVALVAAVAASAALWLPWYAWRLVAGVPNVFSVRDALDPAYLAAHVERAGVGAETMLGHLFAVRQWSVLVPLALLLAVAAAVVDRRAVWLAPVFLVGVSFAFWTWIVWADPDAAHRLVYSSYRYVDATVVAAGLSIPLLGEGLLRALASPAVRVRGRLSGRTAVEPR